MVVSIYTSDIITDIITETTLNGKVVNIKTETMVKHNQLIYSM